MADRTGLAGNSNLGVEVQIKGIHYPAMQLFTPVFLKYDESKLTNPFRG